MKVIGFQTDQLEVDMSEVFLMRGNFYKDKDKELMCNDYEEALNFTFDENQKAKINSLISENCGINRY